MALTDKLTNIADAIRSKGGTTDQLTLAGMVDAINAIQTGGGDGLKYDIGEFVLDADVKARDPSLPHNLGEVPEFILVWTDDFAGLSEENPAAQQCNLGYIWLKNLTGMLQRLTSTISDDSFTVNLNLLSGDYRIRPLASTSVAYLTGQPTAEYFGLNQTGGNNYWRAGVTYKYFVSKAWWNVGGAANVE